MYFCDFIRKDMLMVYTCPRVLRLQFLYERVFGN